MGRPVTLVLAGAGAVAAIEHTFRALFPGSGENPVPELVAYHDTGLPHGDPRLALRGPRRSRTARPELRPLGPEGLAAA